MKKIVSSAVFFQVNYAVIIFFLTLVGGIYGCSKSGPCDPILNIYCNIRAEEWVNVPYHLNDTIKLQYSSNLYEFTQQSIDSGFVIHQLDRESCPGDKEYWQYVNFTYKSVLYQNPLIVKLSLPHGAGSTTLSVIFDRQEWRLNTSHIDSPYYFNSMNINGKTYKKIEKLEPASIYMDTNYYVLYNTTEGVLQIYSNGGYWNRLPQ